MNSEILILGTISTIIGGIIVYWLTVGRPSFVANIADFLYRHSTRSSVPEAKDVPSQVKKALISTDKKQEVLANQKSRTGSNSELNSSDLIKNAQIYSIDFRYDAEELAKHINPIMYKLIEFGDLDSAYAVAILNKGYEINYSLEAIAVAYAKAGNQERAWEVAMEIPDPSRHSSLSDRLEKIRIELS